MGGREPLVPTVTGVAMSISTQQARQLQHRPVEVTTCAGESAGPAGQIYLDDSNRPAWLRVDVGWSGSWVTLVPLDGSTLDQRGLHVAFTLDAIRHAPQVDDGNALWPEEENALYDYYGPLSRPVDSTFDLRY
jgi:hypothetical protein